MKKSTKKLLTGVLSFTLGASLLAACNNGEEVNEPTTPKDTDKKPVEKVEITPEEGAKLLLWDNGDEEGEWAKFVASEFTKKYSIPVKVEDVSHTEASGKLEAAGPTGKGADVFHAAHDHVGNMEAAGTIFGNQLGEAYTSRFVDAAVKGTTGQEAQYGFPLSVETYALYYNKDLVQEPAKTMEELFTTGKKFMDENKGSYALMMEPGNFYTVHGFFAGLGGYVFGNDGLDASDLGLNNEGAIKSGEFMKRMHDELLPLKNEDITGDMISSMFNEGKLMYRISGPWDIKNHKDAKVNFGVTTLPTLENGETPKSFSGVKAYYVSSFSKYPKAATLLAEFATSDEMLMKRYEMTGQLPPTSELLASEEIKNDEVLSGFAAQLEKAVPMPNISEMQKVWEPMAQAYQVIWNGLSTPEDAMNNAAKQVKDAIDSQK